MRRFAIHMSILATFVAVWLSAPAAWAGGLIPMWLVASVPLDAPVGR